MKTKEVAFNGQRGGETLSWRYIRRNFKGHIFEENVNCTASKVNKTWLKYSLAIHDYVKLQQLGDTSKTWRLKTNITAK